MRRVLKECSGTERKKGNMIVNTFLMVRMVVAKVHILEIVFRIVFM